MHFKYAPDGKTVCLLTEEKALIFLNKWKKSKSKDKKKRIRENLRSFNYLIVKMRSTIKNDFIDLYDYYLLEPIEKYTRIDRHDGVLKFQNGINQGIERKMLFEHARQHGYYVVRSNYMKKYFICKMIEGQQFRGTK